jgi:hypothetical protein
MREFIEFMPDVGLGGGRGIKDGTVSSLLQQKPGYDERPTDTLVKERKIGREFVRRWKRQARRGVLAESDAAKLLDDFVGLGNEREAESALVESSSPNKGQYPPDFVHTPLAMYGIYRVTKANQPMYKLHREAFGHDRPTLLD